MRPKKAVQERVRNRSSCSAAPRMQIDNCCIGHFTPGISNLSVCKTRDAYSADRSYFSFDSRTLITLLFILRRRMFRSFNNHAYFLPARNLRVFRFQIELISAAFGIQLVNNQRDYRNRGQHRSHRSLRRHAQLLDSCFADRCRMAH